jgi:PKHD-type hydroxylase
MGETLYESWEDGFTPEECDRIVQYGESLGPRSSTVGSNDDNTTVVESIRKSKNAWITLEEDSEWIYEKLGRILRCMNGMYWRYDIHGFHEDLQYTVYHDDNSCYNWHVDNMMMSDMPPRKLSMSVQLSDPSEYEGGELQFNDGDIHIGNNKRGSVIVFPSYVLHRVTPVTGGTRRSLVVWANGPGFK